MKFIATIVNKKYMSVGGFGHIFYDVLTSLFIAELCDIKYLHSPITSLGDKHHKGEQCGFTGDSNNWDAFLGFETDVIPDLQMVKINFCNPFMSMDINHVKNFIKNHSDNTVFVQANNCRIYPNEMYNYDSTIYYNVINKLKQQMNYLRQTSDEINIAIHIRRGDWCSQPLSYTTSILNIINKIETNKKYCISIYSLGTNKQLDEIKNVCDTNNNIRFCFNTDVFDTFKNIMNSDLIIGGHSNFPKIISLFCETPLIFLPYNDGIIPPLGTNKNFKLYHLGNNLESYENKIETNIHCNKNKNLIIFALNNLLK